VLFEQAALEMLKASDGSKDYATKVRHVQYWQSKFAGRELRSLTSQEIMSALPTHSSFVDGRKDRKLSNATINRFLATIKRILSIAYKREWIDKVPYLELRDEPRVRVRFLTKDQARSLINEIEADWLKHIVIFALATGMRQGEILSLRWESVDLDRRMCWVEAEDAKSGHARAIPLNNEAHALLLGLVGRHEKYVFTRNHTPVKFFDDLMFKKACRAAGIENFRFHDLRHTFASWHAQSGTPLMQLQALGGWKTLQMVLKYAHLSSEHLNKYVESVSFTSVSPTLKIVGSE
jgi:integrase